MSTKSELSEIARALLDAHVRFIVDELTGDALPGLIDTLLDAALEQAEGVTLGEAVSCETIKATARTYAVELTLKGSIPEVVSEVARALHAHPIHERVALGDLIGERRLEDLVDHALEFKALREKLVLALIASPVYESFASELLFNGIRDYLARGPLGSVPGGRSALELGKALAERANPGLEASIEEGLKRYIARALATVSERTVRPVLDGEHDEAVREVLLDSFRRFRTTTMAELREDVPADHLEDLFVTGYELWQELRRTEFIGAMIDAGVAAFFEKYEDATLAELLDEIGITREIMRQEAMRFAPQAIAALHREELLEPFLRVPLARFYESGLVEKILSKRLTGA